MYIVINNQPHFISSDRRTVYPCAVSAGAITVDFSHGTKAPAKFGSIYTDIEIRARLGVHYEQRIDEKTGKPITVSNKTVTSIKPKTTRIKNENSKLNTED